MYGTCTLCCTLYLCIAHCTCMSKCSVSGGGLFTQEIMVLNYQYITSVARQPLEHVCNVYWRPAP